MRRRGKEQVNIGLSHTKRTHLIVRELIMDVIMQVLTPPYPLNCYDEKFYKAYKVDIGLFSGHILYDLLIRTLKLAPGQTVCRTCALFTRPRFKHGRDS